MGNQTGGNKGGFHIGSVGGNLSVNAGGDVVGGDKTTSSSTVPDYGFRNDEQRDAFVQQIETLRKGLEELRQQVAVTGQLSKAEKDAIASDIIGRVRALGEIDVGKIDAGVPPEKVVVDHVEDALNKAGSLLDRVKSLAANSPELALKVAELAEKLLPLLVSARHLFGFP